MKIVSVEEAAAMRLSPVTAFFCKGAAMTPNTLDKRYLRPPYRELHDVESYIYTHRGRG